MNPIDIAVGELYMHRDEPDKLYLGSGRRILFTEREFEDKDLIIIESAVPTEIGLKVQQGDNTLDGYWDGFFGLNIRRKS